MPAHSPRNTRFGAAKGCFQCHLKWRCFFLIHFSRTMPSSGLEARNEVDIPCKNEGGSNIQHFSRRFRRIRQRLSGFDTTRIAVFFSMKQFLGNAPMGTTWYNHPIRSEHWICIFPIEKMRWTLRFGHEIEHDFEVAQHVSGTHCRQPTTVGVIFSVCAARLQRRPNYSWNHVWIYRYICIDDSYFYSSTIFRSYIYGYTRFTMIVIGFFPQQP